VTSSGQFGEKCHVSLNVRKLSMLVTVTLQLLAEMSI